MSIEGYPGGKFRKGTAGAYGQADAVPPAPTTPPMPRPTGAPPTVPPPGRPAPPMPVQPPAPGPVAPLVAWLHTRRQADAPGIYAYGHVPRPPEEPDRITDRRLIGRAVGALLCGLLIWLLWWYKHLTFLLWPLAWFTPDSWKNTFALVVAFYLYYVLLAVLLGYVCGRIGHWPEAWRRYLAPRLRSRLAVAPGPPPAQADPAEWPELRAAGRPAVARRLAAEAHDGRMNDVDYLRLHHAWQAAQGDPARLDTYADAVQRHGSAACLHPSGARDLPGRIALHDLYTAQVRIGTADDSRRNPYTYRGAGVALDPALLGTSMVAVGPPGSGKTRHLMRPIVESLCLQALAGTAAVIAVGAAGGDLGPAHAFDVVIALGDPASAFDLDLYGTTDPDEAAAILAAAMLDGSDGPHVEVRRATTAFAQILGPYRAAHRRFPSVTELRELLDGHPAALAALRDALDEAGEHGWVRELAARERQARRPGDVGTLLADRIALLDRPAFAGFFDVTGRTRPFSPASLEHPLRVRIDLPERGHAEASRMLVRLVLAQFTAAATVRHDRSPFVCLVLDDAAHAIGAEAVRGMQRLRSAHAGVVLGLRTLDEVPEQLRSALLGAVGCRVALSGVTTWDGKHFAEAWGTTWVEESDVTRTPDLSGGLVRRAVHGFRRLVTGEAVTTESVTVRKVERDHWSGSELANQLPPGHAVVSLTTVRGEISPPVLVDLRS